MSPTRHQPSPRQGCVRRAGGAEGARRRRVPRPGLRAALATFLVVAPLALPGPSRAQEMPEIELAGDADGVHLLVDGEKTMVKGVNWDYFPVGTTYNYDFWREPDRIIRMALDREMSLLRAMGGNAIRSYVGIPPRWIEYIYREHGIFTVLNHPMARYGVTVGGVYSPNTDYSDPLVRETVLGEIAEMARTFRGTPGLLMWLLGNENNYGLVWSSAETEDLPEGEANAVRARHMYSLFGEAVGVIKGIDDSRPVAMANGDLQYIEIIAEEVSGLDVFGSNVYRGISFRDLFQEVHDKLGLPVIFTEFGADAWDARRMREDQVTQARYLLGQWREIYEQSAGKGIVGNAIGGLTFQWSDGWWKFGQETNLDIHDTNASWSNDAYPEDFSEGANNMNEEWWGIVAKGPADHDRQFELYPRAAYYALQAAYELDPYGPSVDLAAIGEHFDGIQPAQMALTALGNRAALVADSRSRVHLSGVRVEMETYSTGGSLVSTPEEAEPGGSAYPSHRGFDRMQSFYAELSARPSMNAAADVSVNILGDVPTNPIDEIFYENRGRPRGVRTRDSDVTILDLERVKIYSAAVSWESDLFSLDGFYRTGHYHWGYEGDFFGLYQEANYGPNLDTYNGAAPMGVEIAGKRGLGGWKVAFGPELWWGANPALLAKYQRQVGPFEATAILQEDLAAAARDASASFAVPLPPTRKATLHLAASRGDLDLELGGIWSGSTKEGEPFQIVRGGPESYEVLGDSIVSNDAYGAKARITYNGGRLRWYLQGAAMGLVADGGHTQTQTFTGWTLKDTGSGNQRNVLTGFAFTSGDWQIAPNFLWRKPLVGPVPADVPLPGEPRNILDDPFAVRGNRETTAAELLITYDPTPATWMYTWDSDAREDAGFAASVGFVYYSFATTQDAGIGILGDGRTTFAFDGAPPARDLWEAKARLVAKGSPSSGWIANLLLGEGEPNGNYDRVVRRLGADLRLISGSVRLQAAAAWNDWGPYDYHRDFNLTFPLQLTGDVSYSLGTPEWFDVPQTRLGVRATMRSLDEFSPRYCPGTTIGESGLPECDPLVAGDNGREWEIRTYLHMGM